MFRMCCLFALMCVLAFPMRTTAEGIGNVKDMDVIRKTPKVEIEIRYPVLGRERPDADIAAWAAQLADNFERDYAEEGLPRMPYELRASYALTRPSPHVVSVIWEVSSYTGGAHGNLDMVTASYLVDTGEPVDLHDLFGDLDAALRIMSAHAYRRLSDTLGGMRDEEMLRNGTMPDADNFASFALTPEGVRVFFQPYQVAPWAAGVQQVNIPLDELHEAAPRLSLWGRGER